MKIVNEKLFYFYFIRIFYLDVISELKKYMGLVLAFPLPKSSYATMALREILHRNESKLQTHHQQQEQATLINETTVHQEEEDIEDVVL